MEVKLVIPHLPTVPAERAAEGQLLFSLNKALSSGTATLPARPLPQRDILIISSKTVTTAPSYEINHLL